MSQQEYFTSDRATSVTVTNTWESAMIACVCGDVFQSSGKPEKVRRAEKKWRAKHDNCKAADRPASKTFWMSFCDPDKPKGQQFLGACVIDVTREEADEAQIDVMLRFPFAQPGADWIAAATRKAHELGCNPGGEIMTTDVPPENPLLAHYQRGVLYDRATIERIDAEIARKDHPHV